MRTLMSKQIVGWVEVKTYDIWRGVIKVETLVQDVDNTGYNFFFNEQTPGRGIPLDASRETKYELDGEVGLLQPLAGWLTPSAV